MQFNLAQLQEAIASAAPEREALVWRERRISFAELTDRSRRLANFFLSRDISIHQARDNLQNWQSGQDPVALLMLNGPEYMESMLGAIKARALPFNVNYRYVEEELFYVLNNAQAKAIVYHSRFAPRLAAILDRLPQLTTLIQVADDSGQAMLPGALPYEEVLAYAPAHKPKVNWSPDDLYMLYTGGTTGMPKGVLWRQGDIIISALGGRNPDDSVIDNIQPFIDRATGGRRHRFLATPPLMHGASHWLVFNAWHGGNTAIFQDRVDILDPADVLCVVEREKATVLLLVGDAFGRPLLDEMASGQYDLSSVRNIMNSGALLSQPVKAGLLAAMPQAKIVDNIGASETGSQGVNVCSGEHEYQEARFQLAADNVVLSEDLSHTLEPDHPGFGWLAKKHYVPLGYLDDETKTRQTFPQIDGLRYAVPGDRVQLRGKGEIVFFGRDSATINSGGEKIFAEEVELAIKRHPSIVDTVVSSRPSEQWGNELVAIIQLRNPAYFDREGLLAECAKHIARFKLPKRFRIVDKIQRSPSGKADYRWAKEQAST